MMAYNILNKATLFQGPVFKVERVELTLPDAHTKKYDVIEIQNAVTILPIDEDGIVYFVQQYRVGSDCALLELPAGKIENEETAQATAAREIREEIGMAAGKIELLGKFFMSPGYSTEYMFAYLATGLVPAPLDPDTDEFLNVIKIPLSKALHMLQAGEIEDSKTMATFMLALPHLKP